MVLGREAYAIVKILRTIIKSPTSMQQYQASIWLTLLPRVNALPTEIVPNNYAGNNVTNLVYVMASFHVRDAQSPVDVALPCSKAVIYW